MSLIHHYDDGSRVLLFKHSDIECAELEKFYSGLRFNQVRLNFPAPRILALDPERADIEVLFNVSGAAVDLQRHAFSHPSWWHSLPDSGISNRCVTDGFGQAWHLIRTKCGYRLQGASYDDSLSKLASALWRRIRPDLTTMNRTL